MQFRYQQIFDADYFFRYLLVQHAVNGPILL